MIPHMSKLANRSSTMTLKKLIGVGLAGLAALAENARLFALANLYLVRRELMGARAA